MERSSSETAWWQRTGSDASQRSTPPSRWLAIHVYAGDGHGSRPSGYGIVWACTLPASFQGPVQTQHGRDSSCPGDDDLGASTNGVLNPRCVHLVQRGHRPVLQNEKAGSIVQR